MDSNSAHEGKDIKVYALRDIAADEQLHLSYNECTDCCCYANTYVLPHFVRDYGFVEQYPQRWNFEKSWLIFEVDEVYDGGDDAGDEANPSNMLTVLWIKEPDDSAKFFLLGHLVRLDKMRDDVISKAGALVSEHERSVILGFYDALVTALDLAITSTSSSQDDDENGRVCVEGNEDSCDVSSRTYENLEEQPYKMQYREDVCDFGEANRAVDRDRYRKLEEYKSHYQRLSYFRSEADDDTCLNLNGHQEVCTSVRPHYHEVAVHYAAGFIDKVERVLILGGGDNMLLHEVLKYDSLKQAVVLELDQTVVRSAYHLFGVHPRWNDKRVEWWFGDAGKSLPMLPQDYYGTFDLVLIDLQNDVVEMLDIMGTASALIKPSGIIVRNEDEGFGTNEAFARHTVDLLNQWIPLWCVQGITMGSNNVDVLLRPWKAHKNVPTLHFHPADASQFDLWHSYRKNDDVCKKLEDVGAKDDESSASQVQTRSSGILVIIEAEDIVVFLESGVESIISNALKEAGLTELSTKKIAPEESKTYALVFILQEGYIVARVWPEHKYIAFDLQLWSRFEKQDDAKAHIIKALGRNNSSNNNHKYVSSYRIVTGGMFGSKAWKEDKEKLGPPLHRSKLCADIESDNENEPRDNAVTQDDADIVIGESISLIQANDAAVVAVAICGKSSEPCRVLDVLTKIGVPAMPVWTCPSIRSDVENIDLVRMYGCEMETLQKLREIATMNGKDKIGGIVFDQDVPLGMGQILHKIFSNANQRNELLGTNYAIIETSLNPNESVSSWRRALLDRFRTEFVEFSPAYVAEILFQSNDMSSLELGVFSTGDEDFFSNLVGVIEKIETKNRLAPNVRYVKNGINNYLAEFEANESFTDSDYKKLDDGADDDDTNKEYYLMGGQTIFQFQIGNDDEEQDDISCVRVKDALQGTLKLINGNGVDEADIHIYDGMGEGCVVVALWSKGDAITLWDGRSGIDLNLFTHDEPIE